MAAEWVTMRTLCLKPMGGGRRGRDGKSNLVGGEGGGGAETECLILWFVVLGLIAGGWWWCNGCLPVCQMCLPCPPGG